MSDPVHMTSVVQAYIDGFARADAASIAVLYADDATVRDPANSPPITGREAIHAFYARAMDKDIRLTLNGPVRIAGNVAAFAFRIDMKRDGKPATIDAIDTFEFAPDGLITAMHAYWGPTNLQFIQEPK
ncbi:nuclear transport factor 2 family protein [Brevundimonas terrae]|uniref:Nuclear transport factor 2 family protein n=1 Tax=Brevundimonas terrae TaxID=363631 RepID=A0ABN0XZX5_9CAUL|nr:nuclear transport factor 2 family protein [Brevundimonas terrae]NIJ27794.1 steroid delta-isomerase [Brevundimonas terrae]